MAPPGPEQATEAVGLWILLRAFASGCTAMTGVEAISNGVSAFRDPPVKYGLRTLTAVVAILALLLAGISYLVLAYNVGAMDQTREGYQSVLSQLASAVVGRNWLYYVAIGSLLSVLSISANTSFVDFPRLCRLVAQDGYLPRAFAIVGRRLVFSVGVLYLAGTAGALIVIFGGITDRLIPLFAIGAFLTFTISQTGMVVHWRRELRQHTRSSAHPRASLILNATGAVSTGVALFIIVIAKFAEGAWITLLAIPAAILLLKSIGRYYQTLSWRLREKRPLELVHAKPPIVLVANENWNRLTDKALSFAMTISPDVYAVHLCSTEGPGTDDAEATLRREWERDVERPAREKGLRPPELLMFEAQYRQLYIPLLKLIGTLQREHSDRMIAVLLPELVKQHWWEHLLHTHRARRIRSVLLQYGGPRLVVISVPWRLARSSLTGDLKEEMRTRLTSPSRDRPPTPAASSGANVRAQSPLAE